MGSEAEQSSPVGSEAEQSSPSGVRGRAKLPQWGPRQSKRILRIFWGHKTVSDGNALCQHGYTQTWWVCGAKKLKSPFRVDAVNAINYGPGKNTLKATCSCALYRQSSLSHNTGTMWLLGSRFPLQTRPLQVVNGCLCVYWHCRCRGGFAGVRCQDRDIYTFQSLMRGILGKQKLTHCSPSHYSLVLVNVSLKPFILSLSITPTLFHSKV